MPRRGKRWTHKSVLALMQSSGGKRPEDIIRARARAIVESAKDVGWSGPPFNPLLLASIQGIKYREAAGLISAEAQLTPVRGRQLLLEFNPDRPEGRRNYSICHEIVHTFFDDCYEMVHFRKANPPAFDPESEVEQLCQIGAAELLMPFEEFKKDLDKVPLSLDSIQALSLRYSASREATLRRMISLTDIPVAAAFLSLRHKPEELSKLKAPNLFDDFNVVPEQKLRVLYTACSDSFSIYLPVHKSASDDSCVYAATSPDFVTSGIESWGIQGFDQLRVEAMALPSPSDVEKSNPTVVALIFAD